MTEQNHSTPPLSADQQTQCLGKRIRQARRSKDMTQEALAEVIHCSPTFVSGIERGCSPMSMVTFVAIANALSVSPTQLLQDSLPKELVDCSPTVLVKMLAVLPNCSQA